jgi:uncharacterized membrane protein
MARLASTTNETDTGLPPNIGAGLCAMVPLLGGIVFYYLEKKDRFTRHWAIQSIFFGGSAITAAMIINLVAVFFSFIPVVRVLVAILLTLAALFLGFAVLVLWLLGMLYAFQGKMWEYPYISALCRRIFPNLAA